MSKILIVPLSLCVDTRLQRSIDAFAALGVSKFFMLKNWLSLNKIFNRYRNGDLTTAQIIDEISQKYPGADFTNGRFEAAWNAQTVVTEETKARFAELEELVKGEIEVYLLSTTNPLHHQTIEAQYGKPLPGHAYFSYQHHRGGHSLLAGLLEELKVKHPALKKEDLCVLYGKPDKPFANWGVFGWLRAPFQRWEHRQANHYVKGLERQALVNDFSLLSCDFTKRGTVQEMVKQKGWLEEPTMLVKQPLRFNERYSLRANPKPTIRFNVGAQREKKTVRP